MEALEEADTENQRMILRETARQYPAPFSYPLEKKRQRTSQDVQEAKEVKEAQSVSPGLNCHSNVKMSNWVGRQGRWDLGINLIR
eukprot:g44950.t1